MDLARKRGVTVRRVTVQDHDLDDVFLHYTGRQLRDEVGEQAAGHQPSVQVSAASGKRT